jgi:hypothetical protein
MKLTPRSNLTAWLILFTAPLITGRQQVNLRKFAIVKNSTSF